MPARMLKAKSLERERPFPHQTPRLCAAPDTHPNACQKLIPSHSAICSVIPNTIQSSKEAEVISGGVMILAVFHVQLKEPLINIRLTSASIIIVLVRFRATITSIILWQRLVTTSAISLGRSKTAFIVSSNFAQQQGIRFGWNAGMCPNLCPDLIARSPLRRQGWRHVPFVMNRPEG